MELFQELVFTISFSLIISLLIVKLFSVVSSFDDGNLTVSARVDDEKIEKEWVVCDGDGEEDEKFDDLVKGSDGVGFGCGDDGLGSGVVVKEVGSVGGVGECYVFDEMRERSEGDCDGVGLVESDEGNVVELVEDDCVESVEVKRELLAVDGGECYVFDEMSERIEVDDGGVDLVESDEGNVVESSVSLTREGCVKSDDLQHQSSAVVVGDCYVFDEMPKRTGVNDAGNNLVESDEGKVVEEVCVKSDKVQHGSSSNFGGEDEVFDDDWQGVETTELEKSFGAAVAFMGSKSSADRVNLIDNEVKIELYGLHKVAIEGSCFEPQPMALKVSARANWNSWKRLENLGREDAMEQYIALLSQHVPDWIGRHASDKQ